MGLSIYLLDTNVIINYLDGDLPKAATEFVDGIVDGGYNMSVITKIEVIGKRNVQETEEELLRKFCSYATIIPVEDLIVEQTIQLRKQYKLKTPDAIIAATALNRKLQLLTRNVKDFAQIEGLVVINPWDL